MEEQYAKSLLKLSKSTLGDMEEGYGCGCCSIEQDTGRLFMIRRLHPVVFVGQLVGRGSP